MTLDFDPNLPNPFELKKKTVRLPNPADFAGKDPAIYALALGQAEAQEDRNTMLSAMEWNNKATWSRLEAGEALLVEFRIVRKFIWWGLCGIGSILVLAVGTIIANAVSHYMHW